MGAPVVLTGLAPLTDRLSLEYLDSHGVLPLRLEPDRVVAASWREAPDPVVDDDLALIFGRPVEWVRAPEDELRAAIRRVYGASSVTASGVIAGLSGELVVTAVAAERPLDDLMHQANEAPVVRLVNLLLLEALESRSSDVHLEGYADSLRVRYRIDGVMQEAPSPPAHMAPAVVSRLKIMADLDVAERRLPQDGRIRLSLQDRQVDVRVSTMPTLHGESIVLRLLDKAKGWGHLAELGMDDDVLARFEAVIQRPTGIILVTGPTGSGKTTTLYAAVDRIRTGAEKIVTVEDPVEYELPGVPQVPVREALGLTFASALRALLRQDPDIMLVGEIRDPETAEVAVQAALTGHLVLSTLHTNDAPSAITRLLDLGIEPYLVASTVEAVLAQRLVRVICGECRERTPADPVALSALGISLEAVPHTWRGRGCAACHGTGFRGRTGIYELLVITEPVRRALLERRSATELRQRAREGGMRGLEADGIAKVHAGVTTLEEVVRVARAQA
jgi:general secretion pathway protein E